MGVKYSIIIPTLNEEYFLGQNLKRLKSLNGDIEIIISDGGSSDKTIEIARNFYAKIINSVKGRGTQLNTGAKIASGDIFIFLHADTYLPVNALKLIDDLFEDEKVQIARFKLGFDFQSKLLDLYTKLSKYNSLFTRFGDSAIIIRKEFFYKLNGFADRGTFEDVEFFNRASKFFKIKLINQHVESSARRFISVGVLRQQLLNIFLFTGYLFKLDKSTLSFMYNNVSTKKLNNALIIFLRFPKTGEVKTRLAKTTSTDFAVKFYKSCAENIVKNVKKISGINRFAFYSNEDEKEKITKWLGSKLFYSPQQGADLGTRMKNAFQKVFSTGAKKAIIIGTDVPDLSIDIITNAFNLLDSNDAVIGPAKDGGYYLLGIKKMYSELFDGIEYSTDKVFSETLDRMEKLNLSYQLLPELQDIDTEEDLIRWLNESNHHDIKKEIKLAYETI
ncbi:Hypothetical protein IALB_1975 [Ignavibacterium album JCM 16511]|uniref:Glycosyltransferase 2-like domain-containing protein n=1 Tax=Ignavibacterium album (strain DSM 19864 / JCM 16511 / NBRC 101810 / Mat9-16) TaxID=945713 RepID=I0AL24_IGNAJ|nr:TIGR04282 family arsenosugar biosynthesis glycosyltransferase [Ignavibacterium album]AFH49681.1 Hypothetical protein IALB_1975 [Ignavibacterium album JCM 16511]